MEDEEISKEPRFARRINRLIPRPSGKWLPRDGEAGHIAHRLVCHFGNTLGKRSTYKNRPHQVQKNQASSSHLVHRFGNIIFHSLSTSQHTCER